MRRARLDRGDAQGACSTVLEQAQGAGQKAQQDAQIGQGSIFDLRRAALRRRRRRAGRRPAAAGRPPHPPIPSEEFEQAELLAVEKEAIGLFISAHPLKPVREALRAARRLPAGGARGRGATRTG